MSKKLIEHGTDLAVILDKSTLKKINIDKNTEIEIIVQGNDLIIRAKESSKQSRNDSSVDMMADEILEEYKSVFDKLSK